MGAQERRNNTKEVPPSRVRITRNTENFCVKHGTVVQDDTPHSSSVERLLVSVPRFRVTTGKVNQSLS